MKDEIRTNIEGHLKIMEQAAKVLGNLRAYADSTTECLFAACFREGPRLIQILRTGAFDISKRELPLVAIGAGQFHAQPFMKFLKNTFWPNRLPTVQEGTLAAYWTVDYAIEVGAPMVGGGCDVFYLAKEKGGKYKTATLSKEQLQGHRDFIGAARTQLQELANLRHTEPAEGKQIPTMKNA